MKAHQSLGSIFTRHQKYESNRNLCRFDQVISYEGGLIVENLLKELNSLESRIASYAESSRSCLNSPLLTII